MKVTDIKDAVIVDTRSPAEFEHDHIPGAVNIPIFENNERHEIGKLYKANQEKAFDLGIEYYSRKLPHLCEDLKKLPRKTIVIYCWRGGMRSRAITQLAQLLGHDAHQLEGGYKSYREYVRETLYSLEPRFVVLYGLAGCGKTDLIKKLHPAIDLEGYAAHRSSVFGAIGLKPNSQKMFESLLLHDLLKYKDEPYIFVEGESRKIGDLFIPQNIFAAMGKGIAINVTSSLEERSRRIVRDYFTHGEDEKIKSIIWELRQRLTKETAQHLIELVDRKEYHEVSKILLRDYYDSRYSKYLEQFTYSLEFDVDNDDIESIYRIL
ncbi:MAG: tRNA 2-selenouridine(34) synthase MnmH [Candidatus Woesearchaeota archaeon]